MEVFLLMEALALVDDVFWGFVVRQEVFLVYTCQVRVVKFVRKLLFDLDLFFKVFGGFFRFVLLLDGILYICCTVYLLRLYFILDGLLSMLFSLLY